MYCTSCGQQLADQARFCAKCGAPTRVTPKPAQESTPGDRVRAALHRFAQENELDQVEVPVIRINWLLVGMSLLTVLYCTGLLAGAGYLREQSFMVLPAVGLMIIAWRKRWYWSLGLLLGWLLTAGLHLFSLQRSGAPSDDDLWQVFASTAGPLTALPMLFQLAAVAALFLEYAGKLPRVGASRVWMLAMGLPAIYLCWPGYLVAQEVARRHDLTPREREKAQKLFADHTGRTFFFFRGAVPDTDDHLIIHEPEILPDRYGNVRFTHVLDLNNNRAEAVWQLPYSAMARPDKVTYTSNGGTLDVYYASRDSLALVFHRGGEPDKVYTALSEDYIKSKGRAIKERSDRIFLQRRDSLNRFTASVTGEVAGFKRTGTNQVEVTLRDSKGIRTAIPFCHGDSLVGGVPLGQWETTIVRPGGEWMLTSRQTLLARAPNRGPEDWIQCEELIRIEALSKPPSTAHNVDAKADLEPALKESVRPRASANQVYFDEDVDTEPQFPGGGFNAWLMANMKYPEEDAKAGNSATVMVQFTVGLDGAVSEGRIYRSGTPGMDAEALRLVSVMPNWVPAILNGQPVVCRHIVKVSFKIK